MRLDNDQAITTSNASELDVLLLAALPMELAPLVRAFALKGDGDGFSGQWRVDQGGAGRHISLHAASIGVGLAAGEAAKRVMRERPSGLVVLAGFAGALVDALAVGDCREIAEVMRTSASGGELISPPMSLGPSGDARGAGAVRLVTVDAPITAPQAKRDLAARTGARMVDMETWHVAQAAAGLARVLRVVRVVSDRAGDELPCDIGRWVDAGGRPRVGVVLGSIFRRPRNLGRALALQRHAKRAAAALPQAVGEVLSRAFAVPTPLSHLPEVQRVSERKSGNTPN